MGVKDLLLSPKDCKVKNVSPLSIKAESWFYEEARGINVVVQHTDEAGRYLGTSQNLISWAKLRRALERRDRTSDAKAPGHEES